MSFKEENFLHLNQTSIGNFMKRILKFNTWNRMKRFVVPFDSTKLNLNNIKNPVKNIASSSDKKKSKGETCGTNLWKNHIT